MNRRGFLKLFGLLGLGGIFGGAGLIGTARARNNYYTGPITDHFDGVAFFNPGGQAPKGFRALIKWQLNGEKRKWPSQYPSPYRDTPPPRVEGEAVRVSYVGHATMLVQTAGLNLLFDPVWSERASPVSFAGPKRVNPPGIAFEDLPPIDAVLISHNHYDHLDVAAIKRLQDDHKPLFVTPLGNDFILNDALDGLNITTGDWGDVVELSDTVSLTFEPAHHWSARGITDRRNALWAAFVIKGPGGVIYHVGDTGFHEGRNYKAMREKHGPPRLAILPFGAYEPRDFMRYQHQNPDEAVQGHLLCGAAHTLGHHWGTFQLTDESIEEQIADLDAARSRHGVADDVFRRLQPGEFWDVPSPPKSA